MPPNLKQRTLSFASTKRSASASAARGKKPLRSVSASTPTPSPADRAQSVETISVISLSSSESEDVDVIVQDDDIDVQRPLKKLKIDDAGKERRLELEVQTNRGKGASSVAARKKPSGKAAASGQPQGELDKMDKAGRWTDHYATVRVKMGHLKPIHEEGQSKVHEILRVFDLSYEYGPCVGVTRLERWERAKELGLNPPREVRDILLTQQATESPELAQCVFYEFGV